jgi:hypothetical protein
MKKIVFVRGNSVRTPGIAPRCREKHRKTGAKCIRKHDHPGACEWERNAAGKTHAHLVNSGQNVKHLSRETRLSCLEMIEDPIYRKKLLTDLRARVLRPAVECLLWYYAKGKPKELVEHSGTLSLQEELSGLTDAQLRERALGIASMLKQDTGDRVVH